MITATLLALASLSASSTTTAPAAGYSPDTMRHLKGHTSLPARTDTDQSRSSAATVCHPDPGKGRVCRHHVLKQAQARNEAREQAVVTAHDTAARSR